MQCVTVGVVHMADKIEYWCSSCLRTFGWPDDLAFFVSPKITSNMTQLIYYLCWSIEKIKCGTKIIKLTAHKMPSIIACRMLSNIKRSFSSGRIDFVASNNNLNIANKNMSWSRRKHVPVSFLSEYV